MSEFRHIKLGSSLTGVIYHINLLYSIKLEKKKRNDNKYLTMLFPNLVSKPAEISYLDLGQKMYTFKSDQPA